MKTELSEAQIASYRDNGFLVIEDFLTPEELAHWQTATQTAVDERLGATAPKDDLLPDHAVTKRFPIRPILTRITRRFLPSA